MKVSLPAPSRADSPQLKMVSVILPLFITTVMPREMPMMNATPSSSAAPETKAFTVSSSERPQQMPVRMAAVVSAFFKEQAPSSILTGKGFVPPHSLRR